MSHDNLGRRLRKVEKRQAAPCPECASRPTPKLRVAYPEGDLLGKHPAAGYTEPSQHESCRSCGRPIEEITLAVVYDEEEE
jgi:hypothetical protein